MPVAPDKTIVYILGSSHSGSTLFSLLLGAQEGITCLGETDVFSEEGKRNKPLDDRLCSCLQGNWKQCPFWQSIEKDLQAHHNTSLAHLDLSASDELRFQYDNALFWTAVKKHVGESVLVDSSKEIENYIRLTDMNLNVIPIYLIRSPYGVIWSEVRKGKSWWKESFGYLHYHMQARLALKNKNHLRLRYEELAKNPERTIRKVLSFLEVKNETIEMDWKKKEQHVLRGNKMVYEKNTAIVFDEEWRKHLTGFRFWGISLITAPLLTNRLAFYSIYLKLRRLIKPLLRKPIK